MDRVEYVPGELFFLSSRSLPSDSDGHEAVDAAGPLTGHQDKHATRTYYIHVEKEFPYHSFYLDFGPLHLGHVAAFARQLNEQLAGDDSEDQHGDNDDDNDGDDNNQSDEPARSPENRGRRATGVCVYASLVPQHRANAVCLLACWAILCRQWTAERALAPFRHLRLPAFHDASPHADAFGLTVFHVCKAFERAVHHGLFPRSVDAFDAAGFAADMDPDARDLAWVTPRLAVFAGPTSQPLPSLGLAVRRRPSPREFARHLAARGVSLVVRLNRPKYDAQRFAREGVAVAELYLPDGSCPSDAIVSEFLALCGRHATVAVHCTAGRGRAGTLAAVYVMHAFGFSAEEAVGWLRLCRPGSVVGGQQHFLRELQPRLAGLVVAGDATKDAKGEQATPEDATPSVADEDDAEQQQQQQRKLRPATRGIAARTKSSELPPLPPSPLDSPRWSRVALPPKIPGRPATATTTLLVKAPRMAQGDLLLLRKRNAVPPLPLGASLWPRAPASTTGERSPPVDAMNKRQHDPSETRSR